MLAERQNAPYTLGREKSVEQVEKAGADRDIRRGRRAGMGEKKYPENPAKELLRRYIPMRKRRDALAQEIEDHYSRAYSCTVRLNPYRASGGGAAYDRMAEDICRAADAKQQLAAKIAELNAAMQRILLLIDVPADERQRTVLTLRYVNGMTWEEIQERIGYERTQTLCLHGLALAAINRRLKSADENGLSPVL